METKNNTKTPEQRAAEDAQRTAELAKICAGTTKRAAEESYVRALAAAIAEDIEAAARAKESE